MKKRLIIIIYVDATNYYNRVAYPFASLNVQYFGLEVSYLLVLFRIIQIIKIFLCASFRVSNRFYSGEDRKPF